MEIRLRRWFCQCFGKIAHSHPFRFQFLCLLFSHILSLAHRFTVQWKKNRKQYMYSIHAYGAGEFDYTHVATLLFCWCLFSGVGLGNCWRAAASEFVCVCAFDLNMIPIEFIVPMTLRYFLFKFQFCSFPIGIVPVAHIYIQMISHFRRMQQKATSLLLGLYFVSSMSV